MKENDIITSEGSIELINWAGLCSLTCRQWLTRFLWFTLLNKCIASVPENYIVAIPFHKFDDGLISLQDFSVGKRKRKRNIHSP